MTGGWTIEALKEYVDQRLNDAQNAATLLSRAASESVAIATAANDKRLDLLNEYRSLTEDRDAAFARVDDLKEVKRQLELIAADHVKRQELADIREVLVGKASSDELTVLRDESVRGQGRRTTYTIVGAVAITALSLLFGVVIKGGLTHADVSDQIQKEAPWNRDRPIVLARISTLGDEVHALQVTDARLQAEIQKGGSG